ncbi:CaiB/BaiF CoA transferase family protein [Roseomonas marmotae]|uniref:CoA transferase n=1 Tax=Roseomonas marmotae TaxID=2768161 RepID=A0ABS3KHK2_9PROT|nr:CoA transferase [Roseomonas marmotae]MBO1076939.1 CoA transferase [Roseomonas marmotae]QTI82070.1 CoA transferase [Roseomonas marmotae]
MTLQRRPLEGIVVLDLGQIYQGPYATFLMAMAGAKVIKVEPPTGEYLRARADVGGAAMPFSMLNSNKESVLVDLKVPAGRELFLEMVRRADVVVENFAPETMERLGLGWNVLHAANPRLIYAFGSGYGRSGPYASYPAMDLTIQAMAGIMSITGFPEREPVKSGPALCDFFGGIHLYAGVVTALYERATTGIGRSVDVSLQDAVYPSLASNLSLWYSSGGAAPPRTGNKHGGLAASPYNVYPTSDGNIAIICVGQRQWGWITEAMGRPDLKDDPRFHDLRARCQNMDELDAIIGEWTRGYDKETLFAHLLHHRVPAAPVRNLDEVVSDPNMHARGMLTWVDHPEYGRLVLPNSPIRYSGLEPLALRPSPRLDENGQQVLGDWLGLTEAEIAELRQQGAVGAAPTA